MAAPGIPSPGGDKGASEDEDCGSRVAVKSCADLKSVLTDMLRMLVDLKSERRRASHRAGCCRGRSALPERGYKCEEDAEAHALLSKGDVLDRFGYDNPF